MLPDALCHVIEMRRVVCTVAEKLFSAGRGFDVVLIIIGMFGKFLSSKTRAHGRERPSAASAAINA